MDIKEMRQKMGANYKMMIIEYPAVYISKSTGEIVNGKKIETNRYALLINGEKVFIKEKDLRANYKFIKVLRKSL